MYAQLGNIRFEGLKGFSRFERTRETVYAEIPMIGSKPRLQKTGEKLQEISLGIMFHADFCVPETELSALNDVREAADSLTLVLGNGSVIGDFLITSVKESTRKTASNGTIIAIEADISIREFPQPDKLATLAVKAKEAAFASDINKVVPSREVAAIPTTAQFAANLGTGISISAGTINSNVDTAVRNEGRRPSMLNAIASLSQKSSESALEMAERMRQIQAQVSNATQIISDAENVARFASDLYTAVDSGNLASVVSANSTFQQASALLYSSSATLVTLIASRKL